MRKLEMKSTLAVLTLVGTAALTSGCSTGVNGETVAGLPGSPAWFATASEETQMAFYAQECEEFGFQPGTPHFAMCMKQTAGEMRSGAQQALANMGQQMSDFSNGPEMYTTNCNSFGNSISCNTSKW
ncbi:hypothetical protein [Ruegeria marisrubri]|uniref:hypothetical protein n=1 Tax=Ruegeria marisrubri TaxID=1685379 RepID=UPI0012FDBABA|nr:hypothetical protein [Ruegeria marisrubri]